MALTITSVADIPISAVPTVRCGIRSVVLDNNYATGGYPLTPAQLGLGSISAVVCTVTTAGAGSVTAVSYNSGTGKLIAYAAGAQIANATDVSAVTVQLMAFGT